MPNKTPKKRNQIEMEILQSNFSLLIMTVKVCVLIISIALLYATLGDSFDWDFNNKNSPKVTNSSIRPGSMENDLDKVENGIHLGSGLIYADNFDIVRANCTACHSGKLVAQNRATREGWQQMIRWMQATQGLWDLGSNEPKILDYLEKHYAPKELGRRTNLDIASIEWYILDLEE